MIRIKKKLSGLLAVIAVATSSMAGVKPLGVEDSTALEHLLDSMGISKSDIEAKVQSTLLFGGSAPVSFSGEGKLKLQFHKIENPPAYLREDKSYLQANWEGNESFIRIGMVVRAGRNAVLWSKIGFQNTLAGSFLNKKGYGDTTVAQLGHKDGSPATIHEDMNAGIAIRTVPASFWLKLGAVHWTEASPLTVWKSQPRTFAWEYLPFEVEQPIARYYEYNIAKGEKSGRAAWNKKPFQGVNFESINLPGNLYFNFVWGTFERLDNNEREFVDFSNDIAYAGETYGPIKGIGIGDSYRHILFGRLAVNELIARLTPSIDFTYLNYNNDIYTMNYFKNVFGFDTLGGKGFFKEPFTMSADLRGPLNDKFSMHANFALNYLDTTWVKQGIQQVRVNDTTLIKESVITSEKSRTDLNPAFYLHLESKYLIPASADIVYISKGFYSPLSFATPVDAFFRFGANLLGPGKFIGRGEASPYTQNMAGINIKVTPQLPGYGHLKISYGQHFQPEAAQDVVFFPYRLNGQDMFGLFQSSYNRWGSYPIDLAINRIGKKKYFYRLGDEGFQHNANMMPRGPMSGGLRTDYLSSFEGFVPYESEALADSNYSLAKIIAQSGYSSESIYKVGLNVPKHKKYSFNLEIDGAYDIGPMVGYPRDLFVGVYAALNGVSTALKPLAFDEKGRDVMLLGSYLRLEPAIAVTSKFYILGLVGFENWRSNNAFMAFEKSIDITSNFIRNHFGDSAVAKFDVNNRLIQRVPINYEDWALGLGFDWDMLSRVGLHGRVKWMRHKDIFFKDNNFVMPIISTEIKMWF